MYDDATCYGTATVGEKGQIVIPAPARKSLSIKSGDKMLIFGSREKVLAIIKTDEIANVVTGLTKQLQQVQRTVRPKKKTK